MEINEEAIKEYLKKNLKIEIDTGLERQKVGEYHLGIYDYDKRGIRVRLSLKNEVISEDEITFRA